MNYKQHLVTTNTSWSTNTKEYIVLHHTWTWYNTIRGVLSRLTTGPVSAHYVVDTNGDVYKIWSDDDILRHAGQSSREWKTFMNRYSIGIEILGPLPWFTDQQRVSVRKLVLQLMTVHRIPHTKIIRHKDVSPGRKRDIDDAFRDQQYGSFQAYQQSYTDIQSVIGLYEQVFTNEFYQSVMNDQTVITDIPWAVDRLLNQNGSFNLKEFLYFYMIGLERTKQESLTINQLLMGVYEQVFKQEFGQLIANKQTLIKDIDGSIKNFINSDGTLNLRELVYFTQIGLERLRKETGNRLNDNATNR